MLAKRFELPAGALSADRIAAGVGASLASAFAMIWLRRIGPSESSEAIVFHLSCVGLAAMLAASLPVWKTPTAHDALAHLSDGPTWFVGEQLRDGSKALGQITRSEAAKMLLQVGAGIMDAQPEHAEESSS